MRAALVAALLALGLGLWAAAGAAQAAGGTVTGVVKATPEKYLGETVVYIEKVPGTYPPRTETMDQKAMAFVPHVLTITKGDTVRFLNHDTVAHNVFSPDFGGYNLGTFPPGKVRTHVFNDTVGVYTQLCDIHPEMLAYIFVGQNPYSAVPDQTGRYVIENVPPGKYDLLVWNSHLRAPEQSITVEAGGTAKADFDLRR
jgi:plastocyanin